MSGRSLWCNPALGVAGDMWLAALLHPRADEVFVRAQLAALPLDDWSLTAGRTSRRGLTATHVVVRAPDDDHHRPWSQIDSMLATAPLDERVAQGARRTFRQLGEAEAQVHGIEIDRVHFHEVGAVDAIIDIVGSWAAVVSLDVDVVVSGAVGLGSGTARMAHGDVPVPAPAVLELLVGAPTVPVAADAETTTPTGAALLVTMVDRWGPPPAGTVLGTGRGAGTWDPDSHPNVVTAVLSQAHADAGATVSATVLETNLDDVTGEVLAHVIELALASGADDAWLTPIVMKKGRPGHVLSVLCRPELAGPLRDLMAAETGTLGVRERRVAKHELARRTDEVLVEGHTVRIKVGPHGAKAEHDDVATAAVALARPLREVASAALAAWSSSD
jgi:pyridinium-3,5-bisthiocarboxylic acid mononucleotide nickel chelatase